MLDLFSKAFTDITIKPEQWDMMRKEISATMQQGVSTGAAVGGVEGQPAAPGSTQQGMPAQGAPGAAGAGGGGQAEQLLAALPPEAKQVLMQMKQQGVPTEKIIQAAMMMAQKAQGQGGPQPAPMQNEAPAGNVGQQMMNGGGAQGGPTPPAAPY
jgi:hypothetical protein